MKKNIREPNRKITIYLLLKSIRRWLLKSIQLEREEWLQVKNFLYSNVIEPPWNNIIICHVGPVRSLWYRALIPDTSKMVKIELIVFFKVTIPVAHFCFLSFCSPFHLNFCSCLHFFHYINTLVSPRVSQIAIYDGYNSPLDRSTAYFP